MWKIQKFCKFSWKYAKKPECNKKNGLVEASACFGIVYFTIQQVLLVSTLINTPGVERHQSVLFYAVRVDIYFRGQALWSQVAASTSDQRPKIVSINTLKINPVLYICIFRTVIVLFIVKRTSLSENTTEIEWNINMKHPYSYLNHCKLYKWEYSI